MTRGPGSGLQSGGHGRALAGAPPAAGATLTLGAGWEGGPEVVSVIVRHDGGMLRDLSVPAVADLSQS